MTYILRLDASPRGINSLSRRLADTVQEHLLRLDPTLGMRIRDLSCAEIPHISNDTITGFYTEPHAMTDKLHAATALSDELITELNSANTLIISAPIYNFGVPSSLKAWVDHVVRINETFAFDGDSFTGLVPLERAVLVLSYGANGYTNGGDLAAMDFLEPYLISLLGFLGIDDVRTIKVEGTTGDPTLLNDAMLQASNLVSQLFIEESK